MGNELSQAERVLIDITPEDQRVTRGAAREAQARRQLLKVRQPCGVVSVAGELSLHAGGRARAAPEPRGYALACRTAGRCSERRKGSLMHDTPVPPIFRAVSLRRRRERAIGSSGRAHERVEGSPGRE